MPPTAAPTSGCDWWNLLCQGGQQLTDSGMNAITRSLVHGLIALFGQITKIVDESTRIPLADPTYRHTYYGFAGLAVPVIGVVFFLAVISSAVRRDARSLARATVGIAVAALGGMVYILGAQLLVALDDWLSHGIVAVTGSNFGDQMAGMTDKFQLMGASGDFAADALMLVLMSFALIAGVVLWLVLLLRKMAILVVVAFAPLLVAGWLWTPTRSWSRRATEALVALVFSKSVIYMLFGIGMSLLFRSHNQSLSDFVGVIVLLSGACFAPLVMLRLVHFAADSHLAGEMVGTLRAGAQPTLNRIAPSQGRSMHRRMAQDYATGQGAPGARGGLATVSPGGPRPGAPGAQMGAASAAPSAPATGAASAGGGASAGGAAAAGGPAAAAAAGTAVAVKATSDGVRKAGGRGAVAMKAMSGDRGPTAPGPSNHDGEA